MYKDCKCQTIDGPLIISKANFRPGTGRPPFYFGSPSDSLVTGAMAAYTKRTGRDANNYFAIGDAQVIRDRVAAYVAVGIEKFILRPVGNGDEVIAQTKRLIEEVLPHI